jgi:hypothetical protein
MAMDTIKQPVEHIMGEQAGLKVVYGPPRTAASLLMSIKFYVHAHTGRLGAALP